jgi:hypothetical protein
MPTWINRIWQEFHAGRITRAARDVLLTLATFRGTGGQCWPSHAALADRAGCCPRTVQRALRRARDLGLVDWAERRVRAAWRWLRTSNRYWFTTPADPVQVAERRPVSRPIALTATAAGEGRVSKQEAYERVRLEAAAAPDLLAMRRAAMARGMIGAGVAMAR